MKIWYIGAFPHGYWEVHTETGVRKYKHLRHFNKEDLRSGLDSDSKGQSNDSLYAMKRAA
jgi:hypothetical protein